MQTGMGLYSHVAKGNHTDGLPDAKTDSGCDTTVQALDAVVGVDVPEGVADSHLLWTVRIVLLALHLDSDDLDRLVPGAKTTTDTSGCNLLPRSQCVLAALAGSRANPALGQTAETETRTPVGHLSDGDSVDSLVDTTNTFLAVDIHEGCESGLGLDAAGGQLVLGDLNGLHAGAEAHGGIRLGNTTSHTTDDTTTELGSTKSSSVVLSFGRDEEQDGTLGRGFNPSPREEALVDCAMGANTLACDSRNREQWPT